MKPNWITENDERMRVIEADLILDMERTDIAAAWGVAITELVNGKRIHWDHFIASGLPPAIPGSLEGRLEWREDRRLALTAAGLEWLAEVWRDTSAPPRAIDSPEWAEQLAQLVAATLAANGRPGMWLKILDGKVVYEIAGAQG
jgi:hypothetical protein